MEEINTKLGEHPRCERLAIETDHFMISVNIYNIDKTDPYFKVKRYDENNNLIGLCRIYLYKPEYVTGYNENMILTQDEIYEIMSYFIKIRGSITNTSCWEWLLFKINDIMDISYDIKPVSVRIPIPNYYLLSRKELDLCLQAQ
jgi:hypothetical protein